MILTNCETVPGREIKEVIDVICETAVVTRNITDPVMSNFKKALISTFETFKMAPNIITGKDITGFENSDKNDKEPEIVTKNIETDIEGEGLKEIVSYTNLLKAATDIIKERLIKAAKKSGADAVVNFKITTSVTMLHAFEIIGYGTAVRLN